jgi:hypothetical protein
MSSWGHVRVAIQGPEADLESILAKILNDSYLVTRYPRNLFSLAPKSEDETSVEFECERVFISNGMLSLKLSYLTNHGSENINNWEDIASKYPDVMMFAAWSGEGDSAAAFLETGEIKVWYSGYWDDDLAVKREGGYEYPVPYPFEETVEGHLGEIKEWLEKMEGR